MYEDHFSQNNRDALSNLLCSNADAVTLNRTMSVQDTTCLCSDPEWENKQNKLFNSAEHWLNYLGIKTRTEYGNLLPTYNLFLEIGEYLQRRLTEETDE